MKAAGQPGQGAVSSGLSKSTNPLEALKYIIKRNELITDTLRPVARSIRVTLWRTRSRRIIQDYFRKHATRKLHIGAGGRVLPSWLNTDVRPCRSEAYLDASRKFPFPDCAFHYITSEHVIEHLAYDEGKLMLQECYRILAPGGRIRIVTPDLKVSVDWFLNGQSARDRAFLESKLSVSGWPRTASPQCMPLNLQMREWGHQFLYDRTTLRESLTAAGFTEIVETSPGVSADLHLKGVDIRDEIEIRDLNAYESMVYEATRPEAAKPESTP